MFMYDFVRKVEKVVLKEMGALNSHLNLKGLAHRGCCASDCKTPCPNKCRVLNCTDIPINIQVKSKGMNNGKK